MDTFICISPLKYLHLSLIIVDIHASKSLIVLFKHDPFINDSTLRNLPSVWLLCMMQSGLFNTKHTIQGGVPNYLQ